MIPPFIRLAINVEGEESPFRGLRLCLGGIRMLSKRMKFNCNS